MKVTRKWRLAAVTISAALGLLVMSVRTAYPEQDTPRAKHLKDKGAKVSTETYRGALLGVNEQSALRRGGDLEQWIKVRAAIDDQGNLSEYNIQPYVAFDSDVNPKTIPLRIMRANPNPDDKCVKAVATNWDSTKVVSVPIYTVAKASDPSQNLCEKQRYKPHMKPRPAWENCDKDLTDNAIAVPGYWDANGNYHESQEFVTLSCYTGVIAKCVHWGYIPYGDRKVSDHPSEMRKMLDYLRACVKAARAEYLSGTNNLKEDDGASFTCSRTWIDLVDNIGIQTKDFHKDFELESIWGKDGTVTGVDDCIRPRINGCENLLEERKFKLDCMPSVTWPPNGLIQVWSRVDRQYRPGFCASKHACRVPDPEPSRCGE